jgi:hypothetical protein
VREGIREVQVVHSNRPAKVEECGRARAGLP